MVMLISDTLIIAMVTGFVALRDGALSYGFTGRTAHWLVRAMALWRTNCKS